MAIPLRTVKTSSGHGDTDVPATIVVAYDPGRPNEVNPSNGGQNLLTTATTMYREMDVRFWLELAEAEIDALFLTGGGR